MCQVSICGISEINLAIFFDVHDRIDERVRYGALE